MIRTRSGSFAQRRLRSLSWVCLSGLIVAVSALSTPAAQAQITGPLPTVNGVVGTPGGPTDQQAIDLMRQNGGVVSNESQTQTSTDSTTTTTVVTDPNGGQEVTTTTSSPNASQ